MVVPLSRWTRPWMSMIRPPFGAEVSGDELRGVEGRGFQDAEVGVRVLAGIAVVRVPKKVHARHSHRTENVGETVSNAIAIKQGSTERATAGIRTLARYVRCLNPPRPGGGTFVVPE